jgi:hypothetical protein
MSSLRNAAITRSVGDSPGSLFVVRPEIDPGTIFYTLLLHAFYSILFDGNWSSELSSACCTGGSSTR